MKKLFPAVLLLLTTSLAAAEPAVLNTIEMTDTYHDPVGIPITIFIILLFVSFVVILYLASTIACELKRQGIHHPHKKRK